MIISLQTTGRMLARWTCVAALYTLATLIPISGEVKQEKRSRSVWFKAKEDHVGLGLSDGELRAISRMSDMNHLKNVLNPIMVPRVVGTENHAKVRKHIVDNMQGLGWTVELDEFVNDTPVGSKTFTNIIATLDPNAPRHLVLACHYDSKIDREGVFIGATDSAVPCAMLLNMAKVMQTNLNNHLKTCLKKKKKNGKMKKKKKCKKKRALKYWTKLNERKKFTGRSQRGKFVRSDERLDGHVVRRRDFYDYSKDSNVTTEPQHNLKFFGKLRCCSENGDRYKLTYVPKVQSDLTLQFIFFDGEEAFRSWSRTDSLYGARNLAAKLQNTAYPEFNADATNHLDRMDLFILLDLLGTKEVQFFSYYRATEPWYLRMVSYERRLNDLGLLNRRAFMFKQAQKYNYGVEDDHVPFLERGVPIIHLIPVPFPKVWHRNTDNAAALDFPSIKNLNIIMRAFVADYLHLVV